MTPKQRFIASMMHQKPDDYVAYMEVEFQLHEEYIGKRLIVGSDFEKLSTAEKETALYYNAEVMAEVAEKAGHDAIHSLAGYWEIAPGEPALLWLRDPQDQINLIRALKKVVGEKYYIIGNAGPTMGIPDGAHMYEFVYDLFERPEEIKENLKNQMNNAIEWGYKQIEAGADGIVNCGDIAFNSGPFISPSQCDEFLFPYLNKWVESLKSQGIFSIWHTDGNLMPIMDRIVESGVTAIQCIDPIAGMDIIELKKKVGGKLTLIGNINCAQLQLGTKNKIEEEVKSIVEGCKGNGGFVLSGCNAIFKGIPIENYQVLVEGRYKYGKE